MTANIQMSVVIGFKNWGLNRLSLAIRSVQESFGSVAGEVIVSDYGSTDYAETERMAKSLGAVYIYTATDGVWSRSRALNIGFAHANGDVLACTDADMIFKPGSMEKVYRAAKKDPSSTYLVECRDLPPEWSDKEISDYGPDWNLFDKIGKLRGRWGMGGMVAVSRDTFINVRGLDERMHTYGCEDIDFGERTQRAGNKIVWMRDPCVRMFHMWHPPSGPAAEQNPEELKIVNANREILYKDPSYVRNTKRWLAASLADRPLVTVSIATRNRAKYLPDAIHSVQAQSVQDFEIVIVDDGSSDNTKELVESFGDDRIRYFYQENRGIAAARNLATREARGRYIAVLDDDDIMLPWRLESQLAAIGAGQHGAYGAFVNFDDATAELTLFHEKQISVTTAFERGGAPGHSTWMIETDLLRHVPYDESIMSGEDNNLFLRLLRSGCRFTHCGEAVVLRRLHRTQITQTDDKTHERYAASNKYFFRFNSVHEAAKEIEAIGAKVPWVQVRGGKDFRPLVRPYLPDHLIQRTLVLDPTDILNDQLVDEIRVRVKGLVDLTRYTDSDVLVNRTIVVKSATHADMAALTRLNIGFNVQIGEVAKGHAEVSDQIELIDNELAAFVGECVTSIGLKGTTLALLAVQPTHSAVKLDPAGLPLFTNRLSIGQRSYTAQVMISNSTSQIVTVARTLGKYPAIERLEILTNDAAKKINDYLMPGGGNQ